jgi:NTP pyrophosphatase (non-canonical NTP hydrolase)
VTFDEVIQKISAITELRERKSTQELALKTSEEVGELAQAVLSVTEAPGCKYKNKTWADVDEEAVDTIICAFATALRGDPDPKRLLPVFQRKLEKWLEKLA